MSDDSTPIHLALRVSKSFVIFELRALQASAGSRERLTPTANQGHCARLDLVLPDCGPERANLEQFKKQAKSLLHAARIARHPPGQGSPGW